MDSGSSRVKEKKRALILDGAYKMFAQKGFLSTSMQDIADYCQISRSSIYNYFQSTFEILDNILKFWTQAENFNQNNGLERSLDPLIILDDYLDSHTKVFLSPDRYLAKALVEWYWAMDPKTARATVQDKMDFFKRMVLYGVEQGVYHCDDVEVAAQQVFYLLNGIRIFAAATHPTKEELDRQFDLIRSILGIRDE